MPSVLSKDMSSLHPVDISQKGIVKNILALGYTHRTAVKEYLDNVLGKNDYPGYAITFDLKTMKTQKKYRRSWARDMFMFNFEEKNAIGFTDLEEIRTAFRIADSKREGVNNMGYGIYSPITINKSHDAYGIFIQQNENGAFYSVVVFESGQSNIHTVQGELDGTAILGQDVSELIVPGGTRSMWITSSDFPDFTGSPELGKVIGLVKRFSKLFKEVPSMDTSEVLELGKFYNHQLVKGVKISDGDKPLTPKDILKADEGRVVSKQMYEISVNLYRGGTPEYLICKGGEHSWCKFSKGSTKSFGDIVTSLRHYRDEQKATVTIWDIDKPTMGGADRKTDRKIWVKVGDTFIFSEDFPLNNYPNIRVVLELSNDGENSFDRFISPDANKSNSKINSQIKDRISDLVKYTIQGERGKEFYQKANESSGNRVSARVQVSSKVKRDVWMFAHKHGSNFSGKGQCTLEECTNEMNVWEYDLARIKESAGDEAGNLRPICKPCGKKRV